MSKKKDDDNKEPEISQAITDWAEQPVTLAFFEFMGTERHNLNQALLAKLESGSALSEDFTNKAHLLAAANLLSNTFRNLTVFDEFLKKKEAKGE